MKIQIPENAKSFNNPIFKGIDKVVSKDALKPVMSGAYIKDGNIVATDSHVLIEIDLRYYGFTEYEINILDDCFIDNDLLKELSALKRDQWFFLNESGFNIYKQGSGRVNKVLPFCKMSEVGIYPNYKAVIDVPKKEIDCINFDAKYLSFIQNIWREVSLNPAGNGLKIEFGGSSRPVIVTNVNKQLDCNKKEKGKFLGLVMPIKID